MKIESSRIGRNHLCLGIVMRKPRMYTASFSPPLIFRNPHLQTVLSSSKLRLFRGLSAKTIAQPKILDAGRGIRLSGVLSAPPKRPVKGIVILIHGWEGSAESTYCVRTADALNRNGYSVFRLNLRDHGGNHHMNEGLFYASLLDEVHRAVSQAAGLAGDVPAFMVGFSLGGNFALRVALRCRSEPIENLRHVYCISPVLDPQKATVRIDSIDYIRWYFMKKWRHSLVRKQSFFPRRYDFSQLLVKTSIGDLTDALLERYSQFSSMKAYFTSYTLVDDALQDLPLPTTLLTAADDPIIPVEDFRQLRLNSRTELSIQQYGGHNGYIEGFSLRSWYETRIVSLFDGLAI